MARVPNDVRNLLALLAKNLPRLIGRNFVGLYLYGSLTQRAFDLRRSDIDCIAIVRRDLNAKEFRALRRWFNEAARTNPWTTRVQMSILIHDRLLTNNSHYCLYQFGKLKRGRSDGNPIIWINVLESGVTLRGPNPQKFVPPISRPMFIRALKREAGYLREELIEKRDSQWRDVPFYRAYATMTVCRILYSDANGTVVSKPRAVRWAIKHLAPKWHPIIREAFASGGMDEEPVARIPLATLRKFVEFAGAKLAATDAARNS